VIKIFDDVNILGQKMAILWVNFKICNFLIKNHIMAIDTTLGSI